MDLLNFIQLLDILEAENFICFLVWSNIDIPCTLVEAGMA
jgi:hypothetical protein